MDILEKTSLQQEMDFQKRLWKEQEEQLILSRDNAEIISIKYHDLRHQIALLKNNNAPLSKETLDSIDEALNIYDSMFHTGNGTLDAVLTERNIYCVRNNIRFSCIADGFSLNFMASTDIVALIGNVLENASDAVFVLPQEKRFINLNISAVKNVLSISVENPYLGDIKFSKGLPITTKENTLYHGYGFKSIQHIVNYYNGSMAINTDNGIFCLNIIIPLE